MIKRDIIPFIDLSAQQKQLEGKVEFRINQVLEHGKFILGPEVKELEDTLSAYVSDASLRHNTITCASGTDALQLALMAEDVGPGDAVFLPSFTFTATAEVVVLLGANPVFVDVDQQTFNIDPDDLAEKVAYILKSTELKPRVVIAVDLFGQPADYTILQPFCSSHNLTLIADSAQSMGGSLHGKNVGTLADATTVSFFPAKPLGCYGDGGALFTGSTEKAEIYRSLRSHGKGSEKYEVKRIGVNSRLDTIQAAILLAKLEIFEDEIIARENLARKYSSLLSRVVEVPHLISGAKSVWAQYTIKCKNREKLISFLSSQNIPTAIYYPRPMHLQEAYKSFGDGINSLPISENLSQEVLSLPMHPYMKEEVFDRITKAILSSGV